MRVFPHAVVVTDCCCLCIKWECWFACARGGCGVPVNAHVEVGKHPSHSAQRWCQRSGLSASIHVDTHMCIHIAIVFRVDWSAHEGAIIPTRMCKHTQSCPHMFAHACTFAHIVLSCPCVYAHLSVVMTMRICTHNSDHSRAWICISAITKKSTWKH